MFMVAEKGVPGNTLRPEWPGTAVRGTIDTAFHTGMTQAAFQLSDKMLQCQAKRAGLAPFVFDRRMGRWTRPNKGLPDGRVALRSLSGTHPPMLSGSGTVYSKQCVQSAN